MTEYKKTLSEQCAEALRRGDIVAARKAFEKILDPELNPASRTVFKGRRRNQFHGLLPDDDW